MQVMQRLSRVRQLGHRRFAIIPFGVGRPLLIGVAISSCLVSMPSRLAGTALAEGPSPNAAPNPSSTCEQLEYKGRDHNWAGLMTSDGSPIFTQGDCASYAAQGGTFYRMKT